MNTKSKADAFNFDVDVSEKLTLKLVCLSANQNADGLVFYKATVARDFGYKGMDVTITKSQYEDLSKLGLGTDVEFVATTRSVFSRKHNKNYDIPYNSILPVKKKTTTKK